MTESGGFLMYAQVLMESRTVSFFPYDPAREEEKGLFDANSPAFRMTFNEPRTEWLLVQERCENCQLSPSHLSCSSRGKQQLAHIRHTRNSIGDGISNVMDVRIPGIYSDGRALVWCSALGHGELGRALDTNHETQLLRTKLPTWNDKVQSLVLDFTGRRVVPSAKNFQLASEERPDRTVCQYGKIGPNDFALDFRCPLTLIQAFAISLTAVTWT